MKCHVATYSPLDQGDSIDLAPNVGQAKVPGIINDHDRFPWTNLAVEGKMESQPASHSIFPNFIDILALAETSNVKKNIHL